MFMSLTIIFIANLPTYAQIGITASWSIVICRIIQGISSMGEITGAQLYLSETIKPPVQYPVVAFLGFVVAIGTAASLGVASLIISFGFSWRIAFGLGAVIALVGATARIKLRETPDFADAKLRIKNANERNNLDDKHPIDYTIIQEEKVNQKTTLALFLMDCMWPLCFYFSYIHCGTILKLLAIALSKLSIKILLSLSCK
jgi:MFS family permease